MTQHVPVTARQFKKWTVIYGLTLLVLNISITSELMVEGSWIVAGLLFLGCVIIFASWLEMLDARRATAKEESQ